MANQKNKKGSYPKRSQYATKGSQRSQKGGMRQPAQKKSGDFLDGKIWTLLPIVFGYTLVPVFTMTKDYDIDFTEFDWFNAKALTGQIDSFGYAKGVFLVALAVIALLILGAEGIISREDFKKRLFQNHKVVLICLSVYSVMVLLTSLITPYKELAFQGGGYAQWQTLWVLLGYAVLFFYTIMAVDSERQMRVLIYTFGIGLVIATSLGFLQAIGHNPFLWEWVQKIITHFSRVDHISFQKKYSQVIISFSNPDYCGAYIGMVFPILCTFLFLGYEQKGWKKWLLRLISMGILVMMFVTLNGSGSSSGKIAVIGVAALGILYRLIGFLAGKASGKQKIGITVAVVVVGLVAVIGGLQTKPAKEVIAKYEKGLKDTRNFVNIVNQGDECYVEMRNGETFHLNVQIEDGKVGDIYIKDSKGKKIALVYNAEQAGYIIPDSRFSMVRVIPKRYQVGETAYDSFIFRDAPNNIEWTFMKVNGNWLYYTPFGKLVSLKKVPRFGFKNLENLFNRRGYIYSRTIPLLKQYWFTGSGPNSFIIAFPNHDFVGSKRVGNSTTLVDKPHNVFLQIAVQTGLLSALGYVGIWLWYAWDSIRLYWKRKLSSDREKFGFGLFLGTIGYAIVGITNDTVIGVHVVYWLILAMGIVVNRMIRSQEAEATHEKI